MQESTPNGSFFASKGFPSTMELFYDAQRDYVERYVLGIDPRRQEQIFGAGVKRLGADTHTLLRSQDVTMRLNSHFRRARYEGKIEKFSSHCFVLDPSVRAQGDSTIGYIGNILFEDTIESLIDTLLQRRSMRISSFRMSMHVQSTSPTSYQDDHRQIPIDMQLRFFQQLQSALIEHKNACAIRLQQLQSKKRQVQMVGN